MNKLWILRPISEDGIQWNPWYDKAFGFVVCAPTEAAARKIASESAGDEGAYAWLMPEVSTCAELAPSEAVGVVMMDFHAA